MRRLLILVTVAFLVASCGDADGKSSPPAPSLAGTTTQAQSTSSTVEDSGPAAPDFVLELADGSTFTLSEEQNPVYLVFWAEW